jgi:L-asparaginase
MNLTIITTGGTLDKVYFDAKGGYEVGTPVVRQILANARFTDPIEIVELLRKDSLDMADADRTLIRNAVANCATDGVVITHGKDTMVETARTLTSIGGKTIVLTGALQPGRFSDSDGAFNLGMAVAVAQSARPGVYIVANGRVFDAMRARTRGCTRARSHGSRRRPFAAHGITHLQCARSVRR